ncbi:hypothetical protein G6011_08536 [Alternaria panax]|uniref:Uncharacterized protein n=1 Tax=Alternaria panax TaxID=48097 RepID=A0AAD4FI31_9PLEO|nr:hypothetical protein G6011_08536 [Alternaria panax]
MFTYADEQQDAAVKKEEKKQKRIQQMELAFGIITAVFQLFTTAANILNYRPGALTDWINKFPKAQNLAGKWQRGLKLWTITSGGWLGMQALTKEVVKEINHKKDLHGFEKTLDAVRAALVELDTFAVDEALEGMAILSLGYETHNGHDVVDLYEKDFFFGANVYFRAWVQFVIGMKSYATIISALWKTEGVYIVESLTPSGQNCDQDNRGPRLNKVCLKERPDRSYWVYAMSNYDDKKTRSPPGWEFLTSEDGFHGLYETDVVRSALWRAEVWYPHRDKREELGCREPTAPEPPEVYEEGVNTQDPTDLNPSNSSTTDHLTPGAIPHLQDYGNVPDGFDVPICHSWLGEAISDVDSKKNNNAPCQCDGPNSTDAASWDRPTNWTFAYTKKFIKDSGLYNFDNFGKKCKSCDKMGTSWKALLQLDEKEKPPKHMKKAWNGGCEAKSHKSHPLGKPQLSDPPETSSSASATPNSCTPTPTREPIVQATSELVAHETRYPKNKPKNITRQGSCNGSYCIVDTVYVIHEQNYGYNVDSSVRAGEHACYAGDDWCVEQSAHDICEYPDEEEIADEDEEEEEEVGPDEDEYADFIQDKPQNGTASGDKGPAGKTPDGKTADDGEAQNESPPEKDENTKKFEEELKLANWRRDCICGGNGTAGQHGISCFDKGAGSRTTTIKGRMKQTHTPGKSATGAANASGNGAIPAPAPTDTEDIVYVTRYPSGYQKQVKTVYEDQKRDATLQVASELPSLAMQTSAFVVLLSSYTSFASYSTVTMG